ncbi:thiol-disulfide isomerase [Novosphingobium sp. FSW06-99]|nr:thioredoxin family protein [Novosphingobium sp. FSW06-99]KUR78138.1 thiol-disulfide isomerase [Novosphingobium sp. FSW06-99]
MAAAAMLSAVPAAAAVHAPQVGVASFDQLAQPLPLPYDTHADADRAVTEARQRAIAGHKLLLIDLGGNWCLDCRILAGTIETPRLKAFVEAHYEVVTVDVGRFDKNGQIAARYGITGRLQGVPSVLVVEPHSNKLINQGHTAALADARSMSPQALADWLASWVG